MRFPHEVAEAAGPVVLLGMPWEWLIPFLLLALWVRFERTRTYVEPQRLLRKRLRRTRPK
jgi:hypothetical protein